MPKDQLAEQLQVGAKFAGGMQDLAINFQERRDLAAMNEAMSEANVEMLEATQKWRLENQDDPNNPEAKSALEKTYREIFNGKADRVSVMGRGKWTMAGQKVMGSYKENNVQWGFKQEVTNTENNINRAKKNYLQTGMQLAMAGDIDGALETYNIAKTGIEEFARSIFGEQQTNDILTDFESDYMEGVIGGLLQTDPEMAKELLKRQDVKDSLGNPEREKTLSDMAEKRAIELDDLGQQAQIENESQVTDYITDSTVSMVDKIVRINTDQLAGTISEPYAQLATAMVKSKAALKAPDNTPQEAELIRLAADMKNLVGKKPNLKNSKKFLKMHREFNTLAAKYVDGGKVKASSANTIVKGLNAKLAETTGVVASKGGRPWSWNEVDADKYFKENLVSQSFRNEALRDYFYQTDGKNLNDEEKQLIAKKISLEIEQGILSGTKTASELDKEAEKEKAVTPEAEIPTFKTIQEAVAANLPIGTIIMVGDKKARVK
jgi:hypothetical protein